MHNNRPIFPLQQQGGRGAKSFLDRYNTFRVWVCQVERKIMLEGDINFSWSGHSIQHIRHSCTVTWLSPADPHPDTHTTIKTRASCEPAAPTHCTVQQSGTVREAAWTSEMLECSTYITIPLVLFFLACLICIYLFIYFLSWQAAWRFVGGADKNADSWMCQAEDVSH